MGDVFGYSKESQRFRDLESGKYVSERAVRDAVDRTADLASRRMGDLTARFRAGEITAVEWQTESMAVIKQATIAAALAGYGGRQNMSSEKWGYVGYRVKEQFVYFRKFAEDMLSGRQRWNGRADARARLYGQSARQTYTDIRRREAATSGHIYERNILGAAEHCNQCVGETSRGWVPIGMLVPPGRRTCRGNCRCSLAYSRQREQEEAA